MTLQNGFTNDIPHDCKYEYPELRTLLSNIESSYIKTFNPELLHYYNELEEDTLESLLVKLGDAISVLEFTNRELDLGNQSKDFQIIHNEICVRITDLFKKLESYLKSNLSLHTISNLRKDDKKEEEN